MNSNVFVNRIGSKKKPMLPSNLPDMDGIEIIDYHNNVKSFIEDIYGKELTDLYALFLNRDSSELLVAVQAPGMNRGDVGMLMVIPINKNDLEKLPLSRCTYTALPHFQTEQGVRIGMTREELIALKGDQFYKNKDGYICYTSLSPYAPDDPEAIEYYEENYF